MQLQNRFPSFRIRDLTGISHQSGCSSGCRQPCSLFSIGMFLVATLFRIIWCRIFRTWHTFTLTLPVSGLIRCPFAVPYVVMLQGIIIRIMEDDLIPVFRVLLFFSRQGPDGFRFKVYISRSSVHWKILQAPDHPSWFRQCGLIP